MITVPKEQKISEIMISRIFYAYKSGAWGFIFGI